jgi:aminoglycoside 3-N-acetyltransferase
MTDIIKQIAVDAVNLGISKGDTVLVHSSLRSLGGVPPEDVIKGLQSAVGEEGTLVFPTLSYMHVNPSNPNFHYYLTPSNVGALPEYFRKNISGVIRSINPTHSCCAWGKNAEYVTSGHILDNTPCGPNSPFKRVMELKGKILFLGCGMGPNTSMHAVEELSNPDYLFGDIYDYHLTDANGKTIISPCRAHDFKGVIQRYDRLAEILNDEELKTGKILCSQCCLVSTPEMWKKADEKYRENPHYFIDRIER